MKAAKYLRQGRSVSHMHCCITYTLMPCIRALEADQVVDSTAESRSGSSLGAVWKETIEIWISEVEDNHWNLDT